MYREEEVVLKEAEETIKRLEEEQQKRVEKITHQGKTVPQKEGRVRS